MSSDAHDPSGSGTFAAAANAGSVTAIVPARNEEAVIATCILSLASQPEIAEILVVNDQSTDGTASVVRSLMERISNPRPLGRSAAGQVRLVPLHRCRRGTPAKLRFPCTPNCAGTRCGFGFIFPRAGHRGLV